jgi:hypothetical protein
MLGVAELWNYLQGDTHEGFSEMNAIVPCQYWQIC